MVLQSFLYLAEGTMILGQFINKKLSFMNNADKIALLDGNTHGVTSFFT